MQQIDTSISNDITITATYVLSCVPLIGRVVKQFNHWRAPLWVDLVWHRPTFFLHHCPTHFFPSPVSCQLFYCNWLGEVTFLIMFKMFSCPGLVSHLNNWQWWTQSSYRRLSVFFSSVEHGRQKSCFLSLHVAVAVISVTPVVRINVGNLHIYKIIIWCIEILFFLKVLSAQFWFPCCEKTVLLLWLGFGTRKPLARVRE